MKKKTKYKVIVDILMSASMLLLMGYQFFGDTLHEWFGVTMFILFILHHILNGNWFKYLSKGKYTPYRVFILIVDCFILISMLLQMYSGIVMSRHLFSFLNITGGMVLARKLHIIGAYWGFIAMAFHLGIHWNMLSAIFRKIFHMKRPNKKQSILLCFFEIIINLYGLYAFLVRDFSSNMFLKNEFIFMDYNESLFSFYIDYLAIAFLFISIGNYSIKFINFAKSKKLAE